MEITQEQVDKARECVKVDTDKFSEVGKFFEDYVLPKEMRKNFSDRPWPVRAMDFRKRPVIAGHPLKAKARMPFVLKILRRLELLGLMEPYFIGDKEPPENQLMYRMLEPLRKFCREEKVKGEKKVIDLDTGEAIAVIAREAILRSYLGFVLALHENPSSEGIKQRDEFLVAAKASFGAKISADKIAVIVFGKENKEKKKEKKKEPTEAPQRLLGLKDEIEDHSWPSEKREIVYDIARFTLRLKKLGVNTDEKALEKSPYSKLVSVAKAFDISWSLVLIAEGRLKKEAGEEGVSDEERERLLIRVEHVLGRRAWPKGDDYFKELLVGAVRNLKKCGIPVDEESMKNSKWRRFPKSIRKRPFTWQDVLDEAEKEE